MLLARELEMKNSDSEKIGSFPCTLLMCLIFSIPVFISTAIAADYDNFNGSQVDSALWDIYGEGNESEDASAYTLSGGLLQVDVPASLRFTSLTSTSHFSGDVEFGFDFRDFHTDATIFPSGPPSVSLTLKWQDHCLSMTIYHQDNQNYFGSAHCNDPNGFTMSTTATSGQLLLSRK